MATSSHINLQNFCTVNAFFLISFLFAKEKNTPSHEFNNVIPLIPPMSNTCFFYLFVCYKSYVDFVCIHAYMLINIFCLLYLSLEFVCISPLAMGGFLCFPLSYNISIGGRRSQLATGACSSLPAFDKEIQLLLSKPPTWADCKISSRPDQAKQIILS